MLQVEVYTKVQEMLLKMKGILAEYLAALLWEIIWNGENMSKEQGDITDGISKQNVEDVTWFPFAACSKI